jgi:hypothetical protein
VTGTRPNPDLLPVVGDFVINVIRQGIEQSFTVDVNLTPSQGTHGIDIDVQQFIDMPAQQDISPVSYVAFRGGQDLQINLTGAFASTRWIFSGVDVSNDVFVSGNVFTLRYGDLIDRNIPVIGRHHVLVLVEIDVGGTLTPFGREIILEVEVGQ